MMRRPKRTSGNQGHVLGQQADDGIDFGCFECLGKAEIGQDGGKAAGQHRLARSWRAFEQDIMATGGSDLKRPFHMFLSLNLIKIDLMDSGPGKGGGRVQMKRGAVDNPGQKFNGLMQGGDRYHLNPIDHRRLHLIGIRNNDPFHPQIPGGKRYRQDTPHRPNSAVKGQFTQNPVLVQLVALQGPGGRQDAQGHGQIEPGPALFYIRRCQINGYPPIRKFIATVSNRRLDPILALTHTSIRQANGGKDRQTECNSTSTSTARPSTPTTAPLRTFASIKSYPESNSLKPSIEPVAKV